MPLAMSKPGETFNITRINGDDETKRHLENLGFVVGDAITVVSEMAGNLIVNVKGARIAIDKSMAKRIMVAS